MLSREEVEHIAMLARLELSEDEIMRFRGQLSAILEYANHLLVLDTTGIPPTSSVLPMQGALRADETAPCLSIEDALKNAPRTEERQFRVPPVLE